MTRSALRLAFAALVPCVPGPSPWTAPPALPAVAAVDAYGDGKKAIAADHLGALVDLADWCQSEKAYLQRDEVYGLVLALDPDHEEARRFLKYSKDRETGEWVRRRPYREPRSGKPEAVAAYREKRAALDARLVERRLELVQAHAEDLGPARRDAELRELLVLAPDDERLRTLLGYVRVEDGKGGSRWSTRVAIETDGRREAILEALEAAREAVPETRVEEPDRLDETLDVEWEGLRTTGRVRVVANTDDAEADDVVKVIHAAWDFLPAIVGAKKEAPRDYTVYLIEGESDRSGFIESCPGLDDKDRERLYSLGSTWVPGRPRVACWSSWAEGRIDQAVKQTTVRYLNREFGITTKRGWLVEGVGLYVNQIVLGTRYSRHVTFSDYVDQTEPRIDLDLADPSADWMEIAAEYLDRCKPTRLAATFGRNTSEMTPEDVVLAYSFVAYLREGFGPETLEQILRKVGSGEASGVVAVEEVLGARLPEIHRRFDEWLDEVGSHPF